MDVTAPTPEQLRALADNPKLIDVPLRTVRAALRSAANQIDWAQHEIPDVLRAWDVMRGERDRLRAVIEDAPHAYECFADFTPGANCTCWKADAL